MCKTYQMWLWVLGVLLAGLGLVGCGTFLPEPEPEPPPTAVPALEAGAEAAVARDQVLDYIRESANECVPPDGVTWQTDTAVEQAPSGFEVFHFTAEGCEVTVSAQVDEENAENKFYHVALDDSVIGFCWTAVVDENGEIVSTGSEAVNAPGMANPAAIYCEEQGFRYEITTAEDGSQCGQCIFSDAGEACDAWDFFHGRCSPTE